MFYFKMVGYLLRVALPSGKSKVIRSKSLKHPFIRVGTRNHPVTTIPDYTLLNDETTMFVLDAKSPKESVLNKSHIQQAYSYAIHPEIKCQEFGLCNGRQLAFFNINNAEPALLLNFDEYESRWSDIEKYLSLKYLLKTELRKFSPDFGYKLSRLGIDKNSDFIMLGVRLNLFGKVSDSLMTAGANTDLGGVEHCASFDFPSKMLEKIVAGLPPLLGNRFCDALKKSPFRAAAGLVIELDITVRLGEETQGQDEKFIPLIIKKVHEARFNPSPILNDPKDTPSHIFQLRDAFEIEFNSE